MTAPSTAPASQAVPDERPYVHQTCATVTVIIGHDFWTICDPFAYVSGTMCVTCNQVRPVREFAWADTGENIEAYRARLRAMFPGHGAKRRLITLGSIVGGMIVGLMVGMPFASPRSNAGPITGLFAGLVLGMVVAIVDRVKHRVDWRQYR
jgi:hypothetical protein